MDVYNYFKESETPDAECDQTIATVDGWYGIVDAYCRNETIARLVQEETSWQNFMWYVPINRYGLLVETYRQLVQPQNARQPSQL